MGWFRPLNELWNQLTHPTRIKIQKICHQSLSLNNRTSQLTYEAFINKKRTLAMKSQAKWKKDCELKDEENSDLGSVYLLPRKINVL